VIAKLIVVRSCEPESPLRVWAALSLSDGVFFMAATGALALGYALWPRTLLARVALALAVIVLGWSILNAAWMLVTRVQLQGGVLSVIASHPGEFWPTVRPHVAKRPVFFAAIAGGGLASGVWVGWRLVRPRPVAGPRRRYARRAAAAVAIAMILAAADHALGPRYSGDALGQALRYSSHAHALRTAVVGPADDQAAAAARRVPRAGERQVGLPDAAPADLPNVVIVLLESVSYQAAERGAAESATMPVLARLAAEGVEFTNARVPMPQTGKAFWAALSGTAPDAYHDYVEAVLVDKAYEGLPTLLRRVGYRSAFFQVAKGSFECAPGTFANFGFDWAWFRENLEDASANLGYLAADDFRLLGPAFDWAARTSGPFLLVLITSVAHDPYQVPAWFAAPAQDDRARYAQALRYTDAFLESLCRRLDERGLTGHTLLCVLGDHGDSFRPDARHIRWVPYEEVLRIPWVLRWPGHLEAGLRRDWPCSQMDVTPTILHLLGFDLARAGFDGRDALTPAPPTRRLYFSAWYEGSPLGYVEGARKILYWPRSGDVVAFDLETDETEQAPVMLADAQRAQAVEDVTHWARSTYLQFDAQRFRKRFLYDHWWTFCSGRYARAYYVP
jgi:hypothetical protein